MFCYIVTKLVTYFKIVFVIVQTFYVLLPQKQNKPSPIIEADLSAENTCFCRNVCLRVAVIPYATSHVPCRAVTQQCVVLVLPQQHNKILCLDNTQRNCVIEVAAQSRRESESPSDKGTNVDAERERERQ